MSASASVHVVPRSVTSKQTPSTAPAPPTGGDEWPGQLPGLLPDLERRARFLTREASRAEDLVQDTLERALRFRGSFRSGSNLRAWLLRIMTNTFISQKRRAGIERRVLERTTHDPNAWARPTWQGTQPDLSPGVRRALGALPPGLGRTVQLVDLADYSYRDAAEALEVPVGTVMSRLHRGRARLAARLGPGAISGGVEDVSAA